LIVCRETPARSAKSACDQFRSVRSSRSRFFTGTSAVLPLGQPVEALENRPVGLPFVAEPVFGDGVEHKIRISLKR